MHVWYHKKDNLILFQMIPYLLWLFHQGKGSISKYGIRSQLKSCKMNTMQWRVHKEHVLLCGVMSIFFFSQLVSSSTAWGCGARRWCRHLGEVGSSTRYWALVICHWNQWTLMKSKIPVTISMKIYANQAPATSFCMPLLWLMWWTFCEIKWFESSFQMPIQLCLFVCLFVVCCLQCTCLFEFMLMFMLECITTKETLGNSFINTETKNLVTYQTCVILQLFKCDLTPHFKALHLHVSHNHNK